MKNLHAAALAAAALVACKTPRYYNDPRPTGERLSRNERMAVYGGLPQFTVEPECFEAVKGGVTPTITIDQPATEDIQLVFFGNDGPTWPGGVSIAAGQTVAHVTSGAFIGAGVSRGAYTAILEVLNPDNSTTPVGGMKLVKRGSLVRSVEMLGPAKAVFMENPPSPIYKELSRTVVRRFRIEVPRDPSFVPYECKQARRYRVRAVLGWKTRGQLIEPVVLVGFRRSSTGPPLPSGPDGWTETDQTELFVALHTMVDSGLGWEPELTIQVEIGGDSAQLEGVDPYKK